MTYQERLPPMDIAAEEAVLGCLLIDPLTIHHIVGFLEPEHFFREQHRWIYEAMLKLWRQGMAVDQLTVAHELALSSQLESVGGAAFLSYLTGSMPTSLHVEYYAQCVQRTWRYRDIIAKSGQLAVAAYEAGEDVEAAEMKMMDILMSGTQLGQTYERLKESITLGEQRDDYPFPWLDVERLLHGIRPGKLYIVAGRPSHGKSTFTQNIALDMAKARKSINISSLEDSTQGIIDRLLRMEMGIDDKQLKREAALGSEALMDAMGVIGDLLIWTPSQHINAENIVPRLIAFSKQRSVDLIIVDYVQLLAETTRHQRRYDIVSDISIQLARLAQRINVPIMAVSQLSREVDSRPGNEPQLSDLRESGQLEQDAHAVIFVWRPDRYVKEKDDSGNPNPAWQERYRYQLNVKIAKNKDGPTGVVRLWYDLATGQIKDSTDRRVE